ncbi:MAG TPA: isoleucine--tRNA ligase [Bacteroidia bacterium]|jgi:isoleucyl-tRNA synthetase|nr:isoleucine--tRNA ligase [Bacteroidia bacterium]
MKKYPEYKHLNLSQVAKDVLKDWETKKIFEKSISLREGKTPFVFYEGPPSANGMPGIHHVMARAIKDIFCRYQTQKGKQVKRKAGWDTHGLPIELAVEKTLGITKEDIGKKITVEEYNQACRREVMKYTDKWEDLTRLMGYWVDMKDPYITYENTYIESVWWLLKDLYKKDLLYKGYTIQPYSPAAGTGLSSHELNQPGCYRNVKDNTVIAQFRIQSGSKTAGGKDLSGAYFLAWTTTPWTLPSNTALAVGKNIDYVLVRTYNGYTHQPVSLVLAKDLLGKYFPEKNKELPFEGYKTGDKNIPFQIVEELKGKELEGIRYQQLLPYALPAEKPEEAFRVIIGDFVTTEDGTGIVHIAPTFGADDMRVAKAAGVPAMLVNDENGKGVPLVDLRGRFRSELKDPVFGFAGEFVKEAYMTEEEKAAELVKQKESLKGIIKDTSKLEYLNVDKRIALKLEQEGLLFKKEVYEHNYPHCWRTDKPVLYYPLDSWFIRVTSRKERMAELNKTINWKPESTGTGRFGNWLENANDWNLSRSRFWGIPLPIWRTEDGTEPLCIGSAEELRSEIEKSIKAGFMKTNPLAKFTPGDFSKSNYGTFDLHKPYADEIILVSASGKKMFRESDLIDVWFDSGAMPYAQLHYPFENKELIDERKYFPADFIAEGVDQTRGWFYTLHAIATMCFDSIAYKNVVSNGLVLDKNGNKMSKRLGNAADPFETLEKYGPDATRWYMITNASPWDNLKFDLDGIAEVQRKFFGTLYNTYSFFSIYANIDGFSWKEERIPVAERPEIDRWILSELNSLIQTVDQAYEDYEPTRAGRAIEYFLDAHLSNWYVRLCRRRFWKGEYSKDKIAAYQTLYECMEVIAQIASPIAPFFMDRLYTDLNQVTGRLKAESVHLSDFPECNHDLIDKNLEERMELAQKISSMILSIRKKENIRVRQPLQKIQIPVLDDSFRKKIEAVKELILSEVNVKEIDFVDESQTQIVKNLKLNFKTLGKKCGKHMKAVQAYAAEHGTEIIRSIEKTGKYSVNVDGEAYLIETEDVEIIPVDIPGWKVANEGPLTVALDIVISDGLREEGLARELVNRIQTLRKDKDFDVTDRISVKIKSNNALDASVNNNLNYICSETLASSLEVVNELSSEHAVLVEVDGEIRTLISIAKYN